MFIDLKEYKTMIQLKEKTTILKPYKSVAQHQCKKKLLIAMDMDITRVIYTNLLKNLRWVLVTQT